MRAFAERLNHKDAMKALERPFVHYVCNLPSNARTHFYGIREALPNLKGIAIFDQLSTAIPQDLGAEGLMWRKREIENYLCYPETLEAYARGDQDDFFAERRIKRMHEAIEEIKDVLEKLGKGSPWDDNTKVSDDFLTPLFENYFKKLNLPNIMAKKNFHELARYVPLDKIVPEINEKLDAIARIANSACAQ